MRKTALLLLLLMSLALMAAPCPISAHCPMHEQSMTRSLGEFRVVEGHQWQKWYCIGGQHYFWVRCD